MLATSLILTESITVPEILWTVISLLSALYVFKVFRRALGNLKWLKKNKLNSVREDAARISILTYGALLFVVTMNTVAGCIAMLIPSVSETKIHPLTYLIATVFVIKSLFVAGAAYTIDHWQIRLIRKVENMDFDQRAWDGTERRENQTR